MLSVIIVNSIIAKGPLVFLSLGEQLNGSYDAVLGSEYRGTDMADWSHSESNNNWNLNYTQIQELYGDDLNLSPRMVFG